VRGRPAVGLPQGAARRLAVAVLGLAGAMAGAAQDTAPDKVAWQLELHSKRHSDALRLAAFDDDAWGEVVPRRGRNLVYIDDGLRLSRQQGAWTWAAVARSSATLVAGEAALRLAADVATGRRPAADMAAEVDPLLTNFHLPKGTLVMLASAFAGHAHIRAVCGHAVASRYLFFSYGDAMLPQRTVR